MDKQNSDDPDVALDLLRLRGTQSRSYQVMFESKDSAHEDPWTLTANILAELQDWYHMVSRKAIRSSFKVLFRCDVLHYSIMLLSQSKLPQSVHEYGKILIFEFALEYSELMSSFGVEKSYFTSDDMARCSYVAHRLMDTLRKDWNILLRTTQPSIPPETPEVLASMHLFNLSVRGRLDKMVNRLNTLQYTMESLTNKFGNVQLFDNYLQDSKGMIEWLESHFSAIDFSHNMQ